MPEGSYLDKVEKRGRSTSQKRTTEKHLKHRQRLEETQKRREKERK